jgi:hypothetical protein
VAAVGHRFRGLVLPVASMTNSLVRVTTVGSVVVVALIAAVVSYSHMAQLAYTAGEAWRSYLIPLSIDGLVVAASMVLVTRRRSGLPGSRLAWGALSAGVAASLAANMADARPEVTAVLVAGWPAVAFAVAFELLLQQRRADQSATVAAAAGARSAPPQVPSATPPPATSTQAPLPPLPLPAVALSPEPRATAPVAVTPPVEAPKPAVGVSIPRVVPADDDPDVAARVRQMVSASGGRVPGRRAVAKQLGISEHQARVALDLVGASTGPALNGTAARSKPATSGRGA